MFINNETIKSPFSLRKKVSKDEDYKLLIIPREKNKMSIQKQLFRREKLRVLVYTKLNITLEKLRYIIKNKEIINGCKYEFYTP
jgi:hypothetical protein